MVMRKGRQFKILSAAKQIKYYRVTIGVGAAAGVILTKAVRIDLFEEVKLC